MFFGPQEMCRWARDAVELPRVRCGGFSTIELGRHLEPAIGVEPITCDNPQLRPIESNERARRRLWNCPECYRYTTAECSAERNRTATTGSTRTHNLRPAENYRRIRDELGIRRALPLSYLGIWSRRPDSNRRPRAHQAITQSCDPSKKRDGQETSWEPSHIGGWGGI